MSSFIQAFFCILGAKFAIQENKIIILAKSQDYDYDYDYDYDRDGLGIIFCLEVDSIVQ